MPLLEHVVGLPIPDNDLTRGFDAKLRKTSLEGLLATCLQARSAHHSFVVVVEDCHWLDELSRELLVTLARAVAHLRVVIVLAYRPPSDVGEALGVETTPALQRDRAAELGDADARLLIALEARADPGCETEPPERARRARHGQVGGQPVLRRGAPQLHRGQDIDLSDERSARRDRPPREPQQPHPQPHRQAQRATAADAEGRERDRSPLPRPDAAAGLPGARRPTTPSRCSSAACGTQISSYRTSRRTAPGSSGTSSPRRWHTRASRSRSARSCTRARRRDRGRRSRPAIDQQLDLLAHHYWHSDNLEKKREYLVKAGEAAQAKYANAAAIDYFERARTAARGT